MSGEEYAAHLATAETERDAAQVVKIRNAAINECQRLIQCHGELLARVDAETGRHYRAMAHLLQVLKS